MNAMLADSLDWIADELEAELAKGVTQLEAVASVLKDLMERHGDVIFGGDGYSEEWHRIAVEERGLRNLPTAADALPVLCEEAVIELLARTNVMSAAELNSRYEVYSEQYIMSIGVESRLTAEMAKTTVYPAAMSYLTDITSTISAAAQAGVELESTVAKVVAEHANALMSSTDRLEAALEVDEFESQAEHMRYCATTLLPLMNEVRSHADALEAEVADRYWPLPKYREMLFIK
jgi:glutamine synthetase